MAQLPLVFKFYCSPCRFHNELEVETLSTWLNNSQAWLFADHLQMIKLIGYTVMKMSQAKGCQTENMENHAYYKNTWVYASLMRLSTVDRIERSPSVPSPWYQNSDRQTGKQVKLFFWMEHSILHLEAKFGIKTCMFPPPNPMMDHRREGNQESQLINI